MQAFFLGSIYLIFFLSGAAALIYEVVWVRYLSLVFGGSHLAVTTVLAVFMGGIASGSYLIGKRVGSCRKLLRLYGFLELGIALSALLFVALTKVYPSVYVPLAQLAETSPLYLSLLRVCFALVALIIPTTLMGGTLPVLTAFVSSRGKGVGSQLSFLYGFNTLGAVTGVAAAGFLLLRYFSVSTTLAVAVLINVVVGLLSIALQNRAEAVLGEAARGDREVIGAGPADAGAAVDSAARLSLRLVLWGIGVSGFCALGYEVLWTRMLSIVIGASVYGFATMLMAFLAGIALGSSAYGLLLRMTGRRRNGGDDRLARQVCGFGLVQVVIGITALVVTLLIRDLPAHALFLQEYFQGSDMGEFGARQSVNFILAFSYMLVPAFFMGLAFPLAGKIHADYRRVVGHAVGEILAFNTVGAILGSAVSGFLLIYLFGIERSLQLLTLVNLGFGLLVIASSRGSRVLGWGIAGATAAAILVLAVNPNLWRMWDSKYYAIYQANAPRTESTPEKIREVLDNTEVLYYAEGVQTNISSIRGMGGDQSFLTNGRVEASDNDRDIQCQYTLGHLPMLLNRNPRKVFVLGAGSGMTLGATSVHPEVEQITLAEIEPKVLGVTRTFARYNHNVLENPKLRIVFNDGRNFLLTTREKFDVITADPVHPWFSGAGYIYTSEYFKLAAEHLNPGGIICQWLPIYELTGENLKSIVKTFSQNFKYTLVWLTYIDAELIGSNSPIVIDEEELERRIRAPEVLKDLERVKMGTAEDLLSFFVMGNAGVKAYSSGGKVNTDDNLYLEFSAPQSIGKAHLMGRNCYEIAGYRESILPYLRAPLHEPARSGQKRRWEENHGKAVAVDQIHAMDLSGQLDIADLRRLTGELDARYASYAPWRYMKDEFGQKIGQEPMLLRQTEMALVNDTGELIKVRISAVISRISRNMAIIDFVDNDARLVFGQLKIAGANRDGEIATLAGDVLAVVRAIYSEESKSAVARGTEFPRASAVLPRVREAITLKTRRERM